MIILSIDLMDGKAVQLRQGKERVLTSDRDPVELAREFYRYGEVAVIDLDAALGQGDNMDVIREICKVANVRVGGGVRDKDKGRELLRMGAQRIIVGTAADPELLKEFPPERVMVAIDHKFGEVVDKGWTRGTGEDLMTRAQRLAPYCGGFLCTFVEDEGGMGGMDPLMVQSVVNGLERPVTVAGGVASTEEAIWLSRMGIDVQVGMALYTGRLDPVEVVVGTLDFDKCPQIPTIVQDESGQVLMLAYSTPQSLRRALREGKGIYFSRSRSEVWEKGLTSGHTQELISCRMDCDRDTLIFRVKQNGPACHTGSHSCFGSHFEAPDFSMVRLYEVLKQRKTEMPEGSFSAKMFQNREKLLRKIMEEAYETTYAVSVKKDRREAVWEIADTLYFLSLLAVDEGIEWSEIEAELRGRQK